MEIGVTLNERLGLHLDKEEGHDLKGPCIACPSSDAFRLHKEKGVAQCYSCGGKWSPYQLAEALIGPERAKATMVELGIFQPRGNKTASSPIPPDPLTVIAANKHVTPEALRAYGAKPIGKDAIQLPCYGPDGKQCSQFTLTTKTGDKGLFAKGKPAGLFFPHQDGQVRLPKPGETWHIVEGCKDAAAVYALGELACGLNTCRMAAKFARLFRGVDVILTPDRDSAGEEGAKFTAGVLRGVAKSVRKADLPAEFKESGGADVRDILRRPNGQELLRQAWADAGLVTTEHPSDTDSVTVEIELPDGRRLILTVFRRDTKQQRRIDFTCGDMVHREHIDTSSSVSRGRTIRVLAQKLDIDEDVLSPLIDPQLITLSDQLSEQVGGDKVDQSQATTATEMAMAEGWELWHTPDNVAYATYPVNGHIETWAITSRTFKRFVAGQYYKEHGAALNTETLNAAINVIESQAINDGEEYPVYTRIAEYNGNIYVDLCNHDWQVVEITPDGWRIIDESPVRFRRSLSMKPLPIPASGGTIEELRKFLNVDDTTWILVVVWLAAALRPGKPYTVLMLSGEQGSAKSTTARLLRALIDPNEAPLRAEPRDIRDLMIAAINSLVLAFDNLSYIPPWLSDALCRLSTEGGFATRQLFTDDGETIFKAQRPIILTSIEDVATRADLLDRGVQVTLPAIPETERRTEEEIYQVFEEACPRIFGALLTIISGTLKALPTIKLDRLPRMADFAKWGAAVESALGWPPGTFMAAYTENLKSANELAIEASPIARPLLELLENKGGWEDTANELLRELNARADERTQRQRGWPKNVKSLAGHLKRLAPNLRKLGWESEKRRTTKRRTWAFWRASMTHNQVRDSDVSYYVSYNELGNIQHPAAQEGATLLSDSRMTHMTRMTHAPVVPGYESLSTPPEAPRNEASVAGEDGEDWVTVEDDSAQIPWGDTGEQNVFSFGNSDDWLVDEADQEIVEGEI